MDEKTRPRPCSALKILLWISLLGDNAVAFNIQSTKTLARLSSNGPHSSSRRSRIQYSSQPTSKRKQREIRTSLFVVSKQLSSSSNNNSNNNNNLPPSEEPTVNGSQNHLNQQEENFAWENVVLPPECELPDEPASQIPQEAMETPCVLPESPEMSTLDKVAVVGSTGLMAGLLIYLMRSTFGAGGWRYYLAGGICAAVSHSVPVPVDVVKTRKQIDPTLANASFGQATRDIIHKEGWNSLFVGAGPTFWGYFSEGAIKFGVYEVLKPLVKSIIPIQYLAFIVSAAISGLGASLMLCPMEALRIRLVAEPEYARLGWIQGGYQMVKREGYSSFTKSILPMIYKQVPYTITKNVSFDLFTKLAYRTFILSTGAAAAAATTTAAASASTRLMIPLASAALASFLSCVSSQPGDMLLSVANANGGVRRTHDICRDIMRSERGFRGFFVGIKTRFIHVGIIVTMQLMIYDFVKRSCGIAATGSV